MNCLVMRDGARCAGAQRGVLGSDGVCWGPMRTCVEDELDDGDGGGGPRDALLEALKGPRRADQPEQFDQPERSQRACEGCHGV